MGYQLAGFPATINITLGGAWGDTTGFNGAKNGDVIGLTNVASEQTSQARVYTEDGTLVGHKDTNRFKLTFGIPNAGTNFTKKVDLKCVNYNSQTQFAGLSSAYYDWSTASVTWNYKAVYSYINVTGSGPTATYNFKDLFDSVGTGSGSGYFRTNVVSAMVAGAAPPSDIDVSVQEPIAGKRIAIVPA